MPDFIRSALQTHLYSILFGIWSALPDNADAGFVRLFAHTDGIRTLDENGDQYPLVSDIVKVDGISDTTGTGYNSGSLRMQGDGNDRWLLRLSNLPAGSNTGDDLCIQNVADDGTTVVATPIFIFRANANVYLQTDVHMTGLVGFNGAAPLAKPTVVGSRGGNAALASLLTALASYGLITDSTSA